MSVQNKWQDIANLILGVWLFVSPWIVGYAGSAAPAWNAWVLGAIVAVFALAALFAFHSVEEWIKVLAGLWLLISPYILGFATFAPAIWNQVIVGLLVVGLALCGAWLIPQREQQT